MQPKQGNGATMIHEIGSGFHYLNQGTLAWLVGLNLHIFFVQSLPSPRTQGLQLAFGTQTI
jgi:hypothetical protein